MTHKKSSLAGALLKVALISSTALVSIGVIAQFIPPFSIPFDASRDYGPNAVQKEFIRLNAARFSYVALGDTDHTAVEVNLFSINRRTLDAFVEAGVKNYFLERPYGFQAGIDAVQQGRGQMNFYSDWTCNPDAQKSMNKAFNENIRDYPAIKFVAADKRMDGEGYTGLVGKFREKTLTYSIDFYKARHGCLSEAALLLPKILSPGSAMKYLTDDRQTAELIQSHEGRSAILYGANHFRGNEGLERSMRTLLAQKGKTIVVMDVFKDASTPFRAGIKPDAILYVNPPEDNPDGIKIINPNIESVYEQAKRNVAASAKKLSMN